jgi:hypothetical protein
LLAIAYLSDQLGTGRSQLIAGAAEAWPQRTAAAPARSQQDASSARARPRRLRVRYERAGRRLYSATAAGGAKMTLPILAGGPLEAPDALNALIPPERAEAAHKPPDGARGAVQALSEGPLDGNGGNVNLR